jgi:hypothetical protein
MPSAAQGAWDLFSRILLTGGRAENPRFLDPNQPSSARRAQTNGAMGLTLGASGTWERTELELAYSPNGEFYEDSDLSRLRHDLAFSWLHRYTPRFSVRILENFSYSPERSADPNIAGLGSAIAPGTNTLTSEFTETLVFRATEKSTLAWILRDTERVFSAEQYLDTSRRGVGFEYARRFGQRVTLSSGYEFATFAFRDGVNSPATSPPGPSPSPAPDPNDKDFCKQFPLDPNCILPLSMAATVAAPVAEDLGADRHRAYVGYLLHIPGGFHFALDGGYDLLLFHAGDQGSLTRPFVKSTIGWSGSRLWTRLGYVQGLDEGGGVLANAELRRGHAEARVQFSRNTFLEVLASHESLRSLGVAGSPSGSALNTFRGGTTFGYRLPRDWVLFATFGQDRQRATGTGPIAPEIRANRYAIGSSWSFD